MVKKPTHEGSFSEHIKYITEKDLFALEDSQKFINVQVDQGNTSIVNKVNAFLLNEEPVNVLLGLKMISTGGMNPRFYRSLLVLAKANPDAKVRKEAKKLLTTHGPNVWNPLLENKLLFKSLNYSGKEQDINKKLFKLSQEVGFSLTCELSIGLFERYGKGLRFMVTREKYPEKYKLLLYDLLCPLNHFDLAAGMGFKNWKDKDPKDIILNTHKVKLPIHEAILVHKTVKSMSLHNTKLTAIPKSLSKFKDLKILDLSCNNIAKIPGYFGQLEQIEELDLSMNVFEEFPAQLMRMKQLRKIDFRHNRIKGFMGEPSPLMIPEAASIALPHCEILS